MQLPEASHFVHPGYDARALEGQHVVPLHIFEAHWLFELQDTPLPWALVLASFLAHMQVFEVEQSFVEDACVFQITFLTHPGHHEHHRGSLVVDSTYVPESHPNALAPFSHSSWVATQPHPLSSVQPPEVRFLNSSVAVLVSEAELDSSRYIKRTLGALCLSFPVV